LVDILADLTDSPAEIRIFEMPVIMAILIAVRTHACRLVWLYLQDTHRILFLTSFLSLVSDVWCAVYSGAFQSFLLHDLLF
jgi:hypothetical protein